MSLNLRGFKQINKNASLAYYTQLNYSQAYWNDNMFKSVPWYIGYFDQKTTVEIGQVSGNLIGVYNYGQGIKASHSFLERHKTSAFYVRSPSVFKPARTESFGFGHEFKLSESFKITAKAGRGINNYTNTTIDVATLNPNFNISKKVFFSLSGAVSNRKEGAIRPTSVIGYMAGGNVSVNYFKKAVKSSVGVRYTGPNFSYGSFERLTGNHRTSITVNPKLNIYINNNYQNMKSFNTTGNNQGYQQKLIYNNVVFSTANKFGTIQPGVFYNISDYLNNRVHSRGVTLRFSNFDFHKNILTSTFIKAAYNNPLDIVTQSDYFTFEMSGLIRYRVWNFSAKYNYGALSTNSLVSMQREGVTPQSVRLSIQNQFQFSNPHYVLENSVTYNFNNRFDGHNFGLYPQFYFFTNSGWRYGLQANYNYASSNYGSIYESFNPGSIQPLTERGATTSHNVNISVSIKKEFGIPIPFAKKQHATNTIVAFYDVNGNHMQDKDEPVMENIIIRINGSEVITNKKGEAEMENMPVGRYPFSIIALDKMEGWFPDISDSITILNSGKINVPFVRGVKVYGDVILDRQEIAIADKDKIFDMSRIKITAQGRKTYNTLTDIDGHFEFYLPNGDYTLTMDESILGDVYKISRNNIPITLKTSQDGVYMSFYIVEKRRKVKFKTF
jgi:hypothetical protein